MTTAQSSDTHTHGLLLTAKYSLAPGCHMHSGQQSPLHHVTGHKTRQSRVPDKARA